MTDDCRAMPLYLDRPTLRFFQNLSKHNFPDSEVMVRMLEAEFYDGLGSLLPLGVYWYERVTKQSFQLWRIDSCFDFIPVERLRKPDRALRLYIECLQITKYPDTAKAFKDYLAMRAKPGYTPNPKYALPKYVYWFHGGSVKVHGPGNTGSFKPDLHRARIGGLSSDVEELDSF